MKNKKQLPLRSVCFACSELSICEKIKGEKLNEI